MRPISSNVIMTFNHEHEDMYNCAESGLPLAAMPGHVVSSYRQLLKKVAQLQFHNPRFYLLYRGQSQDYKAIGSDGETPHSNLYPSIFRGQLNNNKKDILKARFETLARAEAFVKVNFRQFLVEVSRNELAVWALLQHYEVCATPLLDVTTSLNTALTFASKEDEGYLFVFGVPPVAGPISASIESQTQVVELQKLCPPDALRPHFQCATLIADYPTIRDVESSHGGSGLSGNNFACRLLCKFHLTSLRAWQQEGFNPITPGVLFPNDEDVWFQSMNRIKLALS